MWSHPMLDLSHNTISINRGLMASVFLLLFGMILLFLRYINKMEVLIWTIIPIFMKCIWPLSMKKNTLQAKLMIPKSSRWLKVQNLQDKNHSLHFKSERDCDFLFMHGHDFSIIPSWKNVILSRRAPPKQVILQIQNTRRYSYETER